MREGDVADAFGVPLIDEKLAPVTVEDAIEIVRGPDLERLRRRIVWHALDRIVVTDLKEQITPAIAGAERDEVSRRAPMRDEGDAV